jgi:hypothetical protein
MGLRVKPQKAVPLEALSFIHPWVEDPGIAVGACGYCDRDDGIIVCVFHDYTFLLPVLGRILDNAEGVDPQVAKSELPGDFCGILEISGQDLQRETLNVGIE